MKKLILSGLIVLLVVGCASIPEPEGDGNSLVIGSLNLYFPDGFFDRISTNITNSIRVVILNTTKNQRFKVSTVDGYYYFLSNGTDSYVVESFEYYKTLRISNTKYNYSLGRNIYKSFTTVPNRIVYLGDITFTYSAPDDILIEEKGGKDIWHFDMDSGIDFNSSAAIEFIQEIQPESSWLAYELVTF